MKCIEMAQYLAPWGGKQLKCCKKHAEQLTLLGRAIGLEVQVAEIPMIDICQMQDEEATK